MCVKHQCFCHENASGNFHGKRQIVLVSQKLQSWLLTIKLYNTFWFVKSKLYSAKLYSVAKKANVQKVRVKLNWFGHNYFIFHFTFISLQWSVYCTDKQPLLAKQIILMKSIWSLLYMFLQETSVFTGYLSFFPKAVELCKMYPKWKGKKH